MTTTKEPICGFNCTCKKETDCQFNLYDSPESDKTTEALNNSIALERRLEKMRLQNETTLTHLSNMLAEFEQIFDDRKECASLEIAQEYIDAATWAKRLGRKDNRIASIEEWIDKTYPPKTSLFDSFRGIYPEKY
jgi:hypothetical protein